MAENRLRGAGPLHYALVLSLVTNVVLFTSICGDGGSTEAATPGGDAPADDPYAAFGDVMWDDLEVASSSAPSGWQPPSWMEPELTRVHAAATTGRGAASAHIRDTGAGAARSVPRSGPAAEPGPAVPSAVEPAAVVPTGLPADVRVIDAPLVSSIPHTIRSADDTIQHAAISAEVSRLLMWDLNVRRDLRPGDRLVVVVSGVNEVKPVIHAVRYESQRFGRTFEAVRMQLPTEAWPSYWTPEGEEMGRRLENAPIAEYETITSLLGDRPNHNGIDFAAPVGVDVMSPWAGTVVRTNWNTGPNGLCVEVARADGIHVKFLHLEEVTVAPGQVVAAGERVGRSGNTGHSTGPHLHYELRRGDAVIDPLTQHATFRRTIPEASRSALAATVNAVRAQTSTR